jgi:crotonobetainyl-CoA:carnitine CoA-transferase CaiB-like acyl-CoA transferase
MAEHTTAHWLEFLQRVDIPHGRVNTLDDLLTDPHLQAVGFFRHLPAGQEGSTVRIAANGVRLNGETATVRTPPRLGEHTREVLAQAGLTATEIEALITSGTAHSG